MSFEPRDYLRHILVEADYLIARSAGVSYETFFADETLRRAFVRSLEIIGEAAKKVPDDFRLLNLELVWDVVQNRIPRLRDQLLKILGDQ